MRAFREWDARSWRVRGKKGERHITKRFGGLVRDVEVVFLLTLAEDVELGVLPVPVE